MTVHDRALNNSSGRRRHPTLWAIALLFLGMFSCVAYQYATRAAEAARINEQNRIEARKVFSAVSGYRAAHGRYPANLTTLNLRLHFSEGTRLLYTATADGQRYWLGIFPHRIATLILPADDFLMEYDSRTRSWDVLYRGDAHAKD